MNATMLSTLLLGFVLGMEHALEPDHMVAVSTIVSRERKPWRAALAGTFWGLGHTTTLLVVGILVLVFKVTIPIRAALSLEFLVGALLVAFGAQILWEYWRKRYHAHSHRPGRTHMHLHAHKRVHDHHGGTHHRKSLLTGMVHGLAGGGALVILVLGTIDSLLGGVVYILIFGVGSILGMMIISSVLGLPFALTANRLGDINVHMRLLSGTVSIVLGAVVMVQIGLLSGLLVPT